MKKIDIQINNAKLLSYNVELKEDKPEIVATIGLFAGAKQISKFSLTTHTWYSDSIAFEVPVRMIKTIKKMAAELEDILILKCSQSMGELMTGE